MHFNLASLSLLATLVSAGPILRARDDTTASINTNSWPVSNFEVGCSPAACVYTFTVSRPAGPNNPGFNTTCEGNDYKTDYQPCNNSAVYARLLPKTYPFWEIDARHTFAKDGQAGSAGTVDTYANGTAKYSQKDFTLTVYKTDDTD